MHYDIVKISAHAFIAIAKKEDYQVATLQPKNFEELDIKIDGYTLVFILDLAAIILEDYNKFFSKI